MNNAAAFLNKVLGGSARPGAAGGPATARTATADALAGRFGRIPGLRDMGRDMGRELGLGGLAGGEGRFRAPAPRTRGRQQFADHRQRALTTAKLRVLVVAGLFSLATALAVGKTLYLGVTSQGAEDRNLADALLPPRGEITDRNGVPLARELQGYSLRYNVKAFEHEGGSPLVKTPAEVARALAAIFPDVPQAEFLRRLSAGSSQMLVERVLPEQANKVMALGEPALEFPRPYQRYYPQGTLAAHVLGYIDPSGNAQIGMEKVLDKRLSDPATRGAPTQLALDMRVQGALEDELVRGVGDYKAIGAAGLVLDVDTGEVIALASLPAFDPNRPDLARNALVFNRATNEVYELGSVIKPITVASAIDAGVVTNLAQRYPAGRELHVGNRTIHDSHDFGASLNVPEALVHSSNIVTAQVADKLGAPRLRATMLSLGMDKRPPIELEARGKPLWPGDNWPRITNMTVSYGHGMAITPLHVATAYAALVNGGIWHPATLLKREAGAEVPGTRVFKAATSARMRQLLRMIVQVGTGRSANAPGFRVGGKTGSAEKASGHGYNKTALITTFASAFPMDHPRYVVVAMYDQPQGTQAAHGQRTAAWNAGVTVGKVIPRIGPLLGIMPDQTRDVDITDIAPLVASGDGE